MVRVNDITQIPARDDAGRRQVFHHYLPDRRSQTRGVTAFAPMADTADHWDDLQFANLVAAKIQSCYTILREMDAGAPVLPFAGGGDHSETTETRPDGETRTLTDIAPGVEIYGYKGEKLRGFVPTLPVREKGTGLACSVCVIKIVRWQVDTVRFYSRPTPAAEAASEHRL